MKKRLLLLLLALALLCGCAGPAAPAATADLSGDTLTVHFVDVGQADCALLECGGEYLLIDGGNVADSQLVVSYLQEQGVEQLKAMVCSHAHEDHVGGLAGVLAVYPTEAVYAPTRTYSSRCFDDFLHYVDQQDLTVQIPSPGDTLELGTATATVLGPVADYPETNNTSLVLRVDFGTTRFLFTGDMETKAETDLLESGADVKADVLKVGHHGSSTSTGYRFLRAVDPAAAVISVGAGNDYGHPHEEVMSRLHDAGIPIYRTDEMGTVTAVSDGTTVTFSWEKTGASPDTGTGSADTVYIGNTVSHKFHAPDCSGLPAEKNRTTFSSYEDAVAAGYTPCGRCLG